MNSYTKKILIHTNERIEFVNITNIVEDVVRESGIQDGLVLVNPMHITASVFINDNEQGLLKDFKIWLEKLTKQERIMDLRICGEQLWEEKLQSL